VSQAGDFKDAIYEQFARIGKATASPRRLEILDLLCQGEKTVEELAEHARIDIKNASAHIKVLRAARLLDSRRDGKHVYYRLADPAVGSFWLSLRSLAEHRLSEIREAVQVYFAQPESMHAVDRRTLLARARRGDVVVLDVRPADEYATGHLPHARSLPLPELKRRLATLPRGKQIVAYCRGPYCVLSLEAVEFLRRRGFRAIRLDDGVLEWRAAGMPIESSKRKSAAS
jgi:rhodanese-related sulfurtransferase/DNA-binding CsgD family transcriptional regulator